MRLGGGLEAAWMRLGGGLEAAFAAALLKCSVRCQGEHRGARCASVERGLLGDLGALTRRCSGSG
eukprot:4997678-Pleurochrysis_carterae.AAC.1